MMRAPGALMRIVFMTLVAVASACTPPALDLNPIGPGDAPLRRGARAAIAPDAAPTALPTGTLIGMTYDEPVGNYLDPLRELGAKAIVRIPFDPGTTPGHYAKEVGATSALAYVMAEPVDSSEVKRTPASQYAGKFSRFLSAYRTSGVDIWEVGNELNGEWLGGKPYTVATGLANPPVAKAYRAWQQIDRAGRASALTLYYQPPQTVTAGYDMVPWARNNFAHLPDMADRLTYVFVSYYEVDNDNVRPTPSQWSSIFTSLHAIFPNAQLGFGEIGLDRPLKNGSLSHAQGIMRYYATLAPALPADATWVAGDFWWFAAEDFDPTSKPLYQFFKRKVVPFM